MIRINISLIFILIIFKIRRLKLLILLIFSCFLNICYSQTTLFVGPSSQFNYYGWNDNTIFSPSIGAQFGIQNILLKKHNICTSFSTHWSKHRNYRYDNKLKQTDIILDLSSEARLFFFKKEPDLFIAPGLNLRYLMQFNNAPDFLNQPHTQTIEFPLFATLSIGKKTTIAQRNFSYSLTAGFTPESLIEYSFFLQLSLLYHLS